MTGIDWWQPIGEPGRVQVRELLSPQAWQRQLAADPETELDLGRTQVADQSLDLRARRLTRLIRSGEEIVAELDLSGPPDFTGAWDKPLTVLGTAGRVVRQVVEERPSRLRGALRYLGISVGERRWVWHFEGGRAAGERLVLRAGEAPGVGAPVVVTFPSAYGRSLGNPKGGATADTRVVSWTARASAADVAIAELCAMSKLHRLVDYRASRVAEGFGELIDHLPRAEGNTE